MTTHPRPAPATLPFADHGEWHWRWVQKRSPRAITLHRVASFERLDQDWVKVYGVETLCGLSIDFTGMPGVLSRMGAPRCRACCRRLANVPPGKGNPYNEGIKDEVLR